MTQIADLIITETIFKIKLATNTDMLSHYKELNREKNLKMNEQLCKIHNLTHDI